MTKHFPWIFIFIAFIFPIAIWGWWVFATWKGSLLSLELFHTSIGRTHFLALKVALISIILGAFPAIYYKTSTHKIGVKILIALIILPIVLGMLARNFAWIGLLSDKNVLSSVGWSFIGRNGSLLHTNTAVILVMGFIFIPWSYFMLNLGLGEVTDIQIQAARTLGANDYQIIYRLFVPALIRSGSVTFFLIYCSSLGYFITPRMVGANTGDLAGNIMVKFVELGEFSIASAVAIILLLTSIPFSLIFLRLIYWDDGIIS